MTKKTDHIYQKPKKSKFKYSQVHCPKLTFLLSVYHSSIPVPPTNFNVFLLFLDGLLWRPPVVFLFQIYNVRMTLYR